MTFVFQPQHSVQAILFPNGITARPS